MIPVLTETTGTCGVCGRVRSERDLLYFDDAEEAALYDLQVNDYICRSCAGWTTDTADSESPLW